MLYILVLLGTFQSTVSYGRDIRDYTRTDSDGVLTTCVSAGCATQWNMSATDLALFYSTKLDTDDKTVHFWDQSNTKFGSVTWYAGNFLIEHCSPGSGKYIDQSGGDEENKWWLVNLTSTAVTLILRTAFTSGSKKELFKYVFDDTCKDNYAKETKSISLEGFGTGFNVFRAVCPKGTWMDGNLCEYCPDGQTVEKKGEECKPCGGGTYSKYGDMECAKCPTDTSSGNGYGVCDDCGVGQYATEGSSSCKTYVWMPILEDCKSHYCTQWFNLEEQVLNIRYNGSDAPSYFETYIGLYEDEGNNAVWKSGIEIASTWIKFQGCSSNTTYTCGGSNNGIISWNISTSNSQISFRCNGGAAVVSCGYTYTVSKVAFSGYKDLKAVYESEACLDGTVAVGDLCVPCKAGTLSSGGKCIDCEAGQYSDEGQWQCSPCPKGHYASWPGRASCTACGPGSYADKEGQSSCISCAYYGMTKRGAVSVAECVELRIAGVVLTSEGVGTQDQIQCALYQPNKWVSQRVVLTLASAIDSNDNIQCIQEADKGGVVVCTSTGAIPGVVSPNGLAALEISVLFVGKAGHEYRCSVQVGEVTALRKVYAELVEIGVYFTDAHRQGEVYLTETVSKAFCGYYNDIVFHRASTMINICDVGNFPAAAPENGFLIGKVIGTCVTALNVEIDVTCNFTAVVGDDDIPSYLTATQVVKILPKCAEGQVIEEGVCQKCETGYRNLGMSQFEGCQACEEVGKAAGPTRGGCIQCDIDQNDVSRAGMSCETCPSGTEANPTTQTCDVCIPGEKAAAKEKCTACPVGEYSTVSGSPVCTACLPGHFQNQTGKTSCSQCPAGKYQPVASQAECPECPAGQYSDQTASPKCTICSPGTLQGQTGQQSCIKCPAGHYQSTAGATLCVECDISKGQYQPSEGSTWCMVTQPGSMLIPGGPGTLPTGCQSGLNGGNYRGTIDVTKSGKKCQKWNVDNPHVPAEGLKHPSAKYPNDGLGDHNYCRNPDREPNPWCYTIDENLRHEECNIPKCEGAASIISVKQCGYNEFSTGGISACTACNKASKEYSRTTGSTYCEICSTELNEGYPFCNKFKCLESSVTSKAINSSGETYTFNETLVGGVFSVPCNSNPDKVEKEYITRYCKMVSSVLAKWSSLNYTQCTNQNTAAIQNALKWDMKNLKNGTRDMSGLIKGMKLLPVDIVLVGKGLSSLKKETLQGDIDTIGNVANIVASLVTNTDSLTVIDNSDKAVILATMDTLVDSMESGNRVTAGTMGLSVIKGGAALPSTEHMNATDLPKLSISSELDVAVVVFSHDAASLFPGPTADESNDGTAKVNKSLESAIVSIRVAGNFSSFKLELSSDSSGDEEKHGKGKVFERTCQFLDTTDNTWSTEGCVTTLLESGKYECECTHNTSFAILLSVSEIKDTSQDTASTVMGAFNLVFLVLTFLSLAPFKKFRQRQLMQIQINLVLSLILANVGFIILSYTTTVTVNELGEPLMSLNVGCIAGTVIVQWLFLSVMAWMTCAAYTLYGKIVDALKTYGKTDRFYLLKCSIGCWVFPVILPIAACVTSYGMNDSKGEYTSPYVGANANFENGTSCWVDAPWKWVSFFLPCWACLIVNFVMIAMIARVIIRSAKSGSSAGGNHAREIKALVTIAFTVGVPWIFAALTIGVIAQVFQWLFIIVTGLQGLGMFICFVIFQEEVLNNLFSLVGQSPPAFLMAPKTRSPKELATAKPTTSVTRVERDEKEEEDENEAAIEFKEGDDMTQNIYSNIESTEKEEKEEKEEDGVRREPELV